MPRLMERPVFRERSVHRAMAVLFLLAVLYNLIAFDLDIGQFDIETEYMPPEILTRGIFVLIVPVYVAIFYDTGGRTGRLKRNALSPKEWTARRMHPVVPLGIVIGASLMITVENNWDLDLRGSVAGLAMFALLLVLLLLPFFLRCVKRDRPSAALIITASVLLMVGEMKDMTAISYAPISEEVYELFSGMFLLYAVLLVASHETGDVLGRLMDRGVLHMVLGSAVFTAGNTLLMCDHGAYPPLWLVAFGSIVTLIGLWILVRTVRRAIDGTHPSSETGAGTT